MNEFCEFAPQVFFAIVADATINDFSLGVNEIGIPASLAIGRTLRPMLYGLGPADPLTIFFALAGIAIVTLAAALFPAYRASFIDPTRALRME